MGRKKQLRCPPHALGICASSCLPGHLSICGTVITPCVRYRCCSKWITANDLITYISTPWLPCVSSPTSTPPWPPASPPPSTLAEFLQFIHGERGTPWGGGILEFLFVFYSFSYPYNNAFVDMVSCIQFANSYQHADVLTFEIVLNHYLINGNEKSEIFGAHSQR